MKELILDGKNLGEKQRHLNLLVNEAVTKIVPFEIILSEFGNSDVDNLFKIDIASHYRNVEYIIEMLKCEDMLYVSRAIKKCPWLITDQQYAHLINPQHLHTHLFPHMTTKAINKLLLHIRLNLRDEKRVDDFFKYVECKQIKQSLKWLPSCSQFTVEEAIAKHATLIKPKMFKKICEMHPSIFEKIITKYSKSSNYMPFLKSVVFLLNTDGNKYLDKLEELDLYDELKFSKRSTSVIMKKYSNRIFNKDKFFLYIVHNLDIKTVAKYVKPEKAQDVILNILKSNYTKGAKHWFTFENINPFIKQIPKEDRFGFIKNIFIDKVRVSSELIISVRELFRQYSLKSENVYQWYRHAPFSIAFPYLKEMIKTVPSPDERTDIIHVMLTAAGRDLDSILKVVKYYHEFHINETLKNKLSFINTLLQISNTHQYDDRSWKLLDEIFHSAEVYSHSDKDVQNCVEAIIVYNILHQIKNHQIIERKFKFNSLKRYRTQLSESERDELFKFLLNYVQNKIDNQTTYDQDDVNKLYSLLENVLDLLKDWDKDLCDYEKIIKTIKVLINLKFERGMIVKLNNIYNKNKTWRKILFEDSILLSHEEQVLLNALRHDSDLLLRHIKQVELIRLDDNIILYRFLSKLRIYWSNTLAKDWAKAYCSNLNESNNDKVIIRSVCALLPIEELSKIINKYSPVNAHIFWAQTEEKYFASNKNFGQFMHVARPQPSPDLVLRYAIGDYTQFAMPSLNAIFFYMPSNRFRKYLPQLLRGDITLQKLGIQIAFAKLETDELCAMFGYIWESCENVSVRAIIFKESFNLLCQQKSIENIEKVWTLLEMFIDNLTDEENPSIYKCLGLVWKVPNYIRTKFAVKSYNFLKTLPARCNCHFLIEKVALSTANLMDTIDPDFVINIILDYIDTWIATRKMFSRYPDYPHYIIEIVGNFLLNVNTETDYNYRYKKAFKPWLTGIFLIWPELNNENDNVAEDYFETFLQKTFEIARRNSVYKKYLNANIFFKQIQLEIETCLPFDKAYTIITFCKLSVVYFLTYEKIKHHLNDILVDSKEEIILKHEEMWSRIAPILAAKTLKLIERDIAELFPSILYTFWKCLSEFINVAKKDLKGPSFQKELIKDDSCELGYRLAIKVLSEQK